MTDTIIFFVRVIDPVSQETEVFQIATEPETSLGLLTSELISNGVSTIIKQISKPRFYVLKTPYRFRFDREPNPPDVPQMIVSLQDENKYTNVHPTTFVTDIAPNFIKSYLYLVIEGVPDGPEIAIATLKKNFGDIYRCLLVNVQFAGQWTWDDVLANGGSFIEDSTSEMPEEIRLLENRLREKRSFDTSNDDPELTVARRFSPHFDSSYFCLSVTNQHEPNVKNTLEFMAFNSLLRFYLPNAQRYQTATSSSTKLHALKTNFVLPPFFLGRRSTDNLAYHEQTPWKFPLFVSCPLFEHHGFPRQYTPTSDFSVWFRELDFPLIVGQFQTSEQNRYPMLLHAIALARLVVELLRPGSTTRPFIVAIYLTANLTAERYILMKTEGMPEKVSILQRRFDLTDGDAAIDFQREMYNLASELEYVLTQLDQSKKDVLAAIKDKASMVKSLHFSGVSSEEQRKKSHDPWSADEDDLGVFGDDTVIHALKKMNCKVGYVAFGHPNIATIVSRTCGEMAGSLKFVKDGGNEIEILLFLDGLPSESNHTVRPLGIWPVTGGSIIAMPVAGNYLTDLHAPDTHLWSLATQLFEAVLFMHNHNIAHMDLKPSNLLIPSEYGRLTVVDFGLSVRLKNEAQLLEGYVGTKGYIAPEVGQRKFSPIRADLWSVGKVVQKLCKRCGPSRAREWLLAASEELLDQDPRKRPMMSDILQRTRNFDPVATPDG